MFSEAISRKQAENIQSRFITYGGTWARIYPESWLVESQTFEDYLALEIDLDDLMVFCEERISDWKLAYSLSKKTVEDKRFYSGMIDTYKKIIEEKE